MLLSTDCFTGIAFKKRLEGNRDVNDAAIKIQLYYD